ncbi:hypothetical protein ARTHROSP310_35100 [Arthrobacter sp. AD-310]
MSPSDSLAIDFSPALASIIAKAYSSGVETSIQELSRLLQFDEESKLVAALSVAQFVEQLRLELAPNHLEGEFSTLRVLRPANLTTDPASHVRQLLERGEGPSVEFKSSMLCSMREWEREGRCVELLALPGELLKTICAFLNGDGGDLLVGVNDAGRACNGVQLDLQLRNWNLDKWQLHFGSLISGRFHEGTQIQSYLRTTMVQIDSFPVFHVEVMPRGARSFVRKEKNQQFEFFVRNGPRTDSLDLPSFYSHVLALTS